MLDDVFFLFFCFRTNVQRVPRALVLHPVMKVDSTEEEEDDDGSPFDWIANAFHRMMRPSKKVHHNRKFLGPIRVPGLNDDVFIKQLQSNAKNRVVIRVMPQPNMNMPYDQSQYYHNQQFQPQPPSYYYQQQQQQTSPTRQLPSQTSGGFMPVSQPTLSSWTQPQQYYQQNYNKNLPNNYNNNNYQYQNYQQPRYQYSNPSNYQSYYQPHLNPYSNPYSNQQQNSYGTWNNIPNKSSKTNYNSGSFRSTNYPNYPPYNEQSHENYDNYNHTISDDEYNQLQNDETESIKTTTAKIPSSQYNEVFRSDRMVPTNPTWKNRFWVNNKSGKSTTTTTTERSHDDGDNDDNSNKNNDDNDSDDVQKGKKRSLKGRNKFSSTGIQVISAPDLNNEKENDPLSDSSSRIDDDDNDGVIIKNHSRLNRGESLDHTNDNKKIFNDENLNWKSSKSSSRIINDNIKLNNSTENNVKRIMSLSENHWKHYNLKRPVKNLSDNKNNKNKKIRVVENVVSSVSMTSSKGTLKLPKSKNYS